MVRETKKPSFIRLDQRTNEELKTQTKMLCEVRTLTTVYNATHNNRLTMIYNL